MTLTNDDRADIARLAIDYAHAVDDRDWERFAGVFTADASIDYRSSAGIDGPRDEIVAWMPGALQLFEWTLHSVSTHRIVGESDGIASGVVHFVARHGLVWEGVPEQMDVVGVYRDTYARTPDGWRMTSRREDTMSISGGAFAAMVSAAAADDGE